MSNEKLNPEDSTQLSRVVHIKDVTTRFSGEGEETEQFRLSDFKTNATRGILGRIKMLIFLAVGAVGAVYMQKNKPTAAEVEGINQEIKNAVSLSGDDCKGGVYAKEELMIGLKTCEVYRGSLAAKLGIAAGGKLDDSVCLKVNKHCQ